MTRPHGKAQVDRRRPRAFAVCDRCGFLYNRMNLQWQYEWAGPKTVNLNLLVCDPCLDIPQEQLRTFILPADPVPILNPRPERYKLADNPVSPIAKTFGTMTQGAGTNAVIDSNTNKSFAFCAATFTSTLNNTVGVNFSSNNNPIAAASFTLTAPNNAPFLGSGATGYQFQGSNNNVVYTTLSSGTTAGTKGEVLNVVLGNTTTPYQYFQVVLTGDNVHSVAIAQLQINQSG